MSYVLLTFAPEYLASSPEPADCAEIGRVSRIFASAHQRQRVHDTRIMVGERRCLVIDYSGAISAGRTIQSAQWRMDSGYAAQIDNERIQGDGRSVAVDLTAVDCGQQWITCEATLDNGEVYMQAVHVAVADVPSY